MPNTYGYSGPAMAVGAMSSALGDFFKKQLETEQQIPQLQQTMANIGQMQRQQQVQEAMLPGQLQQMKQGIQKGALELGHLPEQYQMEKGRFGFESEAAQRQREQYERAKSFQWPYEAFQRERHMQAMQELQDRTATGKPPMTPQEMNQWIVKWGDVLGEHPLAKHYHMYDPALQAQREAHARYFDFLSKGGNVNKPMTPAQSQTALANARRQAEATTQAKLKEFGLFNPAQLGNLAERSDAYEWMVDNEHRRILTERGLPTTNLGPQRPMPSKLKQLMTQPEEGSGIFGTISGLWNRMFGGQSQQQQKQPMFSPQPQPTPVPEDAPTSQVPSEMLWKIEEEK